MVNYHLSFYTYNFKYPQTIYLFIYTIFLHYLVYQMAPKSYIICRQPVDRYRSCLNHWRAKDTHAGQNGVEKSPADPP